MVSSRGRLIWLCGVIAIGIVALVVTPMAHSAIPAGVCPPVSNTTKYTIAYGSVRCV